MATLDGMRSFGARAFHIYPGEWQRLLLLYLFAFALNTSVIWGQATSDSLFLQQVGPQFLPAMFVGDALITVIAILIYSSFVDRIANVSLMVMICLLGGVSLVLARVGLFWDIQVVYPLLFLFDRLLRAVITIHAWTYIAGFYDTRMAKRHFPLIGSGSRTSGILAGALLFPLSFLLGANNLVLAWLVVLLLCGGLAWLIPRLVPPVQSAQPSKTTPGTVFQTFSEGGALVMSSSFLRLMAVAAVAGTALLYLLEYQSQVIIVANFANAEEQATFYGLLGALADAITLPIQMVLLGRLVTRFGVGNTNMIFPGLSALSYGLLAFWPSLISASVARINRTALRSAFRTPIDGMLYNALSPNVKGRARAFINGVLVPLGALCAGLLLLLIAWAQLPTAVVVPLGLTLALLYVVTAWQLRGEYGPALINVLETDDLASLRIQRDHLGLTDPATLSMLRQRLDESQDDETTIFLAEMLYDLAGPLVLPQLRDLALQRGPQVRASIIVLLRDHSATEPVVRQLCIESLSAEHENVRMAALRALLIMPAVERDTNILDTLLELLHKDDTTRIRELILPPLIASNQSVYQVPARQLLNHWLASEPYSEHHECALRVLARTGDAGLLPLLAPYLENRLPTVRQKAVEYLNELIAHARLPVLQQQVVALLNQLCKDTDERIRLAAISVLGTLQTTEARAALRAALSDTSFRVRQCACDSIDAAEKPFLEEALDSSDCLLLESMTFLLAADVLRARRQVPGLVEQLIHAAYALSLQRMTIQPFDTPAVRLLDTRLHEQTELLLERAFWLLSALHDKENVWTVFRALRHDTSARHANALEALEALSSPPLARLIAPLLASTPLPDLAQIGHDLPVPEATTPWQFLLRIRNGATGNTEAAVSCQLVQVYRDDWILALVLYTSGLSAGAGGVQATSSFPELPAEALSSIAEACLDYRVPLVRETAGLLLSESSARHNIIIGEAQMLTTIEKLVFLKQVPFFSAMTIEQLYVLASISEEMTVEAEQTVLSEGAYVDALYVIVSGRIALQRRQKRRQDSIMRIATLQAREYFAEMSVFDNEPLSADVVALEQSRLLLVRQAPLLELIKHYPELGLALLRVLSQRLRQVDDRFAEKLKARPKKLVDLYDTLDSGTSEE